MSRSPRGRRAALAAQMPSLETVLDYWRATWRNAPMRVYVRHRNLDTPGDEDLYVAGRHRGEAALILRALNNTEGAYWLLQADYEQAIRELLRSATRPAHPRDVLDQMFEYAEKNISDFDYPDEIKPLTPANIARMYFAARMDA